MSETNAPAKSKGSTLIPSLRYRDAHAAIAWLKQAFGFEAKAVYEGANHTIDHAELTLGPGMIMLGTGQPDNPANAYIVHPDEIGTRNTQGIYVVVPDCTDIHATAQAAGAKIVMPLQDMSYGGKAFSCLDPEGHLWSFGEYDPWAPTT